MRYTLNTCSVCGSESIEPIDKKIDGLDTYIIYKCNACDEIVSASKPKVVETVQKKSTEDMLPVDIYSKSINSIVIVNSDIDEERTSAGTGFAISSNGYILTNAHNVTSMVGEKEEQLQFEINNNITIKLNNGLTYDCDLVNIDLKLDLAILKTSDDIKIDVLSFGSYDDVKTGERVLTIGNSKGEGLSITEGLVSDRARKVGSTNKIMISIPINHGNSGGPLFNYRNEVIGVVSMGKNNAVAMNYAIPSNDAIEFIKKTERNEEIKILN